MNEEKEWSKGSCGIPSSRTIYASWEKEEKEGKRGDKGRRERKGGREVIWRTTFNYMNLQIQEAELTQVGLIPKRSTQRHFIIKCQETMTKREFESSKREAACQIQWSFNNIFS